jgi:hypothetical protein
VPNTQAPRQSKCDPYCRGLRVVLEGPFAQLLSSEHEELVNASVIVGRAALQPLPKRRFSRWADAQRPQAARQPGATLQSLFLVSGISAGSGSHHRRALAAFQPEEARRLVVGSG